METTEIDRLMEVCGERGIDENYLTVYEVSKIFKIPILSIYKMINSKKIKHIHIDVILIQKNEIISMLEREAI